MYVVAKPTLGNKKADVAEHPEAFLHVGLLLNEPASGPSLFLN
jgi:hypothetical protein